MAATIYDYCGLMVFAKYFIAVQAQGKHLTLQIHKIVVDYQNQKYHGNFRP